MNRNNFIFGIVLTVFLAGCTKDVAPSAPPPLIHSPYEGSFAFTTHFTSWYASTTVEDTTYTYNGSITQFQQGMFKMDFNPFLSPVTIQINSNGSFTSNMNSLSAGQFSDADHVSFHIYSIGLGGGSLWDITGVRH